MDRRMTKRAQRQAVLAAIARREWLLQMRTLSAASCRRSTDHSPSRGNTMIVALSDRFDRPLCPDYDGETLVFLPLVRENELTGERQACLATHWERSADYREWTYRLRPDVRWHDGRPVTVEDVTFTLALHSRPDSPYMSPPLTESVTVHDALTFTVRGGRWCGPDMLDRVVSILPKHLLHSLDCRQFYEWDFWLRPVGNGPYRYLRHEPHTMVELEANRDYYKGSPKVERVVLKFAGQSGLTEVLSGNVDAITMNPALPAVVDDARFRTYWEPNNAGRTWAICWRNEHPLFRDRDVRRALSLAINRRELLEILNLQGQLSRVDGVYTRRQLRRGEGTEPRYDRAEAGRLLDQAGWRARTRDGVRERGGRDFRFTALTLAESPGNETTLYVQDQLRDLGVNMEVQRLERGALLDRLWAGTFEAIVTFLVGTPGEIGRWTGGVGYRTPHLTQLLEAAGSTFDPEAQDQVYREMSDLMRADQPVAFLFRSAVPHLVHRRVKGLNAPWRSDPLKFTEELWLDDRAND